MNSALTSVRAEFIATIRLGYNGGISLEIEIMLIGIRGQ